MNEKFYLGVDTSILLSNFEFKKASEFVEGDEMQGNEILRKEYVNFPDNMYRIITKYGNSFVINGDNTIILYNSFLDSLGEYKINDILNNYVDLYIYNTTIEFFNQRID